MRTEILRADHPTAIVHAVDVLDHGGLVAFPTDTVYGLGAHINLPDSIESLYIIKGQRHPRAVGVLLAEIDQISQIAINIPQWAWTLARTFLPGALTLILPRHPNLPEQLLPLETVAVRIPAHPVALSLLRRSGPLAVTSANLSGESTCSDAEQVLKQLHGRFHLILDGGQILTPQIPSTIVDCTTPEPEILRPGPISREQIAAAI
ncbi:MAG: hypothetical protein OHK0052_08780 [Anaerolineales bacterium]